MTKVADGICLERYLPLSRELTLLYHNLEAAD